MRGLAVAGTATFARAIGTRPPILPQFAVVGNPPCVRRCLDGQIVIAALTMNSLTASACVRQIKWPPSCKNSSAPERLAEISKSRRPWIWKIRASGGGPGRQLRIARQPRLRNFASASFAMSTHSCRCARVMPRAIRNPQGEQTRTQSNNHTGRIGTIGRNTRKHRPTACGDRQLPISTTASGRRCRAIS